MKNNKKIAVIGGSGVKQLPFLSDIKISRVNTLYGDVKVQTGRYKGKEVIFLPRHGHDFHVPPHLVNYRANIAALDKLGTDYIIATAAVGSLDKTIKPGDLSIIVDFMDDTRSRKQTFFEKGNAVFTDMTEPYDPKLNGLIASAIKKVRKKSPRKVIYVATEGPRFETKAEIRAYRMGGADVVGMTGFPEVALANEVRIPYASIAISTNYACGIAKERLSMDEVIEVFNKKEKVVLKVIEEVIKRL